MMIRRAIIMVMSQLYLHELAQYRKERSKREKDSIENVRPSFITT